MGRLRSWVWRGEGRVKGELLVEEEVLEVEEEEEAGKISVRRKNREEE